METKYIYSIISSFLTAIGTIILAKYLGRKKENIEIALKYQEFYQKHINDLKAELEILTTKVDTLIIQNNEKDLTIEQQKINLLKWEGYCEELKEINKEQKQQISKLFKEIEEHEKK